ncbi:MAG: TRAP transporter substrate-binding protein [Deltaproteobacteria bacterium]|nr:MAG: TRAP transporter substrate-binding protein [Deltaproteobacteria bacterium]
MKTLLAAVLLLCAAAPSASAQTELKLGHVGSPGSLFALSADEFARRVKEKTKGKVVVTVFGSSQLGDDTEMMQKVKLGTLDMTLPSTVMSSLVPAYGLFEMPYLVRDRDHMKRIEKEIVWPTLAPLAEKSGYKVIAVWENGFRQITNNAHPIKVPEDLRGIKLRVPKGKWRIKMFQAYGASPSAMGFSEVFVALQTGVMDGEENPLTQIYTAKFQEVQKFLSMTEHVYTPAYLVVSVRKWASLPADQRKAVEEAAKETQPFVYENGAKMDKELLGKIKEAGLKVNEADKAACQKASKPVYDEFGKEVPNGKEMIDKALALGQSK